MNRKVSLSCAIHFNWYVGGRKRSQLRKRVLELTRIVPVMHAVWEEELKKVGQQYRTE